jgi:hypothetical protein
MRARTPRNTGTLKNIGKFPSLKNKSTIWFESHLERDFIYLIEFDKSVTKYQEQPFKVKYFLDGTPFRNAPPGEIHPKNIKKLAKLVSRGKLYGQWEKQISIAHDLAEVRTPPKNKRKNWD